MKTIGLSLCLLVLPMLLPAQTGQIEATSEIKAVTVYFNGARIERQASVQLQAGENEVVLPVANRGISLQSIRAEGKGRFTILSVRHKADYLNQDYQSDELEQLVKKKEELEWDVLQLNAEEEIYAEELEILEMNRDMVGYNKTVSIQELNAALAYHAAQRKELARLQSGIEEKLKEKNKEIEKLEKQIGELSGTLAEVPLTAIIVKVEAAQATQALFDVSYLISTAGWVPYYDIRFADVDKPLALEMKAMVSQYSGEEWEQVELSLSTGNPQQNITRPQLSAWYLYYYEPEKAQKHYYKQQNKVQKQEFEKKQSPSSSRGSRSGGQVLIDELELSGGMMALDPVGSDLIQNSASTVYQISKPYDISATGKEHTVGISKVNVPAGFAYYAAPRYDDNAFLTAYISEWEKLNLVASQANIFMEGSYIGKTFIDPAGAEDTITISLGRDKRIAISRVKDKEFTKTRTFSSTATLTEGWKINIRNNRNREIRLFIEEPFPVSTDSDIEIELLELSGAKKDMGKGLLKWDMLMQSGESKELIYRYTIEYPEDETLNY